MNGVMGKAGKVWIRAGKVILATAACIARCCRTCPGPVLRRKCDRYCPDTTTAYGFWRIDLDRAVDNTGKTWRQWIAENDAALTPCRLIQFGTNPEECYVLDRNCSRCFWNPGCGYRLDIPALPVATFTNPRLATCDDCIVCAECCESMLWRGCDGFDRCIECGSSYKIDATSSSNSIYQVYADNGAVTYDETISRQTVAVTTNDCVDVDPVPNRCNSTARVQTHRSDTTVSARWIQGGPGQYVERTVSGTTGTGRESAQSLSPIQCGAITRAANVISFMIGMGNPQATLRLDTPDVSFLTNLFVRGSIQASMLTPCNGSFTQDSAFFDGVPTIELRVSWNITFNGTSGFATYNYTRRTYSKPQNQPRIFRSLNTATGTSSFQFTRIDECEQGDPLGCNGIGRRRQGDQNGIGNGARDVGGIIGG